MGKFFFITYSENIENAQLLRDRIKQYDDYINFLDNNWFVYSDDSAQVIYKKLSKGEFEDDLILVMAVDLQDYWGRLTKDVWDWLKKERGTSH